MQAFSVRELKSNPSTVLKAAEADAMALVTSHQPLQLSRAHSSKYRLQA